VVGEVAGADLARSAGRLDGGLGGGEPFGAAGDQDDVTAVLGKTLCDGTADAATRSGDDGDALVDDRNLPRRSRGVGRRY